MQPPPEPPLPCPGRPDAAARGILCGLALAVVLWGLLAAVVWG